MWIFKAQVTTEWSCELEVRIVIKFKLLNIKVEVGHQNFNVIFNMLLEAQSSKFKLNTSFRIYIVWNFVVKVKVKQRTEN